VNRSSRVASFIVLVALLCIPRAATPSQLSSGDTLVYAVTLELQQHRVPHAPLPEESSEAAGEGSETLHIYSIGPDGTAYAKVEAVFRGVQDGKPVELHGNFFAKVLPDGQIRVRGGLDPTIDQALNFANAITREVSAHSLAVGRNWRTVLDTDYVNLTVQRQVTGRKVYQQFPAAVIESTASGTLKKSSDGSKASGSVTLGGTSYYDDRDHLLIGESIRMLTIVRAANQAQGHTNYSASVNVVLSSLTHAAAPAPQSPLTPAPQAAASPTATPEPQAVPTGYGA
jgi:hypothetical protein